MLCGKARNSKDHGKWRQRSYRFGFSEAEARNLSLRRQLMIALRSSIQKEKLTQAQAGERLTVTQPRIKAASTPKRAA
jgi:predicted XRE-type DNA-binding protein